MSIEAMKQALNALVRVHVADNDCDFLNDSQCNQVTHAVNTLRTAIQQAEAKTDEPVGEPRARVELMKTGGNAGLSTRIIELYIATRERLRPGDLLYTHPAPGVPDDVARNAIATVREQYRGTDWGKAAECICDAIDAAMLAAKDASA